MTIRHLKTFIKVVETGSVSRAAEELCVAQPSVSQTIKELENYYDAHLFNREGKKLTLTIEGEALLAKAKEVVYSFSEFEDLATKAAFSPTINIGATMTFGTFALPHILDVLKQEIPHGDPHFYIDKIAPLEEKIIKGDLDFALIEGISTNKHMKVNIFGEDKLVVVAGQHFDVPNKIKLKDIVKYDLLIREVGSAPRRILDSKLLSLGIKITNPRMESISNMIIIAMTANNKGLGVLPYDIVKRYVDEGRLRIIETDTELLRKLCIISHKNKRFTSNEKKAYLLCEKILKSREQFNIFE